MQTEQRIAASPIVAILRGVRPVQVVEVADVLYAAGIRIIEVPLNSPEPFASIAALAAVGRSDWVIGAGTVLSVADVQRTRAAGGQIIIAPNCNADVIHAALDAGLQVMPGIATATEAFSALQAGAKFLKLFPAITYGPRHLQALGAVLPSGSGVFPVGGIGTADIPAWLAAGAAGFGFGSELFKPSYSLTDIAQRATALMAEFRKAGHKLKQE
jgi:2-dehydro-3-deoxyphosphogalactonate aldolase